MSPNRIAFGIPIVLLLAILLAASIRAESANAGPAWFPYLTSNVAPGEYGLWRDLPHGYGGPPFGPSVGDPSSDAGLLWFKNNQKLNETNGYRTNLPHFATSGGPDLVVRAAVNDGALFEVGYVLDNERNTCSFPSPLMWNSAEANNEYVAKSLPLPAGHMLEAICLVLSDNPNSINQGRTSVLIDFICTATLVCNGYAEGFGAGPN
jgi:hypothetical protein